MDENCFYDEVPLKPPRHLKPKARSLDPSPCRPIRKKFGTLLNKSNENSNTKIYSGMELQQKNYNINVTVPPKRRRQEKIVRIEQVAQMMDTSKDESVLYDNVPLPPRRNKEKTYAHLYSNKDAKTDNNLSFHPSANSDNKLEHNESKTAAISEQTSLPTKPLKENEFTISSCDVVENFSMNSCKTDVKNSGCVYRDQSKLDHDIDNNLKRIECSFETLDEVLRSLRNYTETPSSQFLPIETRRLSCDVCVSSSDLILNDNESERVKELSNPNEETVDSDATSSDDTVISVEKKETSDLDDDVSNISGIPIKCKLSSVDNKIIENISPADSNNISSFQTNSNIKNNASCDIQKSSIYSSAVSSSSEYKNVTNDKAIRVEETCLLQASTQKQTQNNEGQISSKQEKNLSTSAKTTTAAVSSDETVSTKILQTQKETTVEVLQKLDSASQKISDDSSDFLIEATQKSTIFSNQKTTFSLDEGDNLKASDSQTLGSSISNKEDTRKESSDFLIEASSKPTIFSKQTTTFSFDEANNAGKEEASKRRESSDFLVEATEKTTIFSTQKATFSFEEENNKKEESSNQVAQETSTSNRKESSDFLIEASQKPTIFSTQKATFSFEEESSTKEETSKQVTQEISTFSRRESSDFLVEGSQKPTIFSTQKATFSFDEESSTKEETSKQLAQEISTSDRRESSDFLVEASQKPTIFSNQKSTFSFDEPTENLTTIHQEPLKKSEGKQSPEPSDFLTETTQKQTIFSTQTATFSFDDDSKMKTIEQPTSVVKKVNESETSDFLVEATQKATIFSNQKATFSFDEESSIEKCSTSTSTDAQKCDDKIIEDKEVSDFLIEPTQKSTIFSAQKTTFSFDEEISKKPSASADSQPKSLKSEEQRRDSSDFLIEGSQKPTIFSNVKSTFSFDEAPSKEAMPQSELSDFSIQATEKSTIFSTQKATFSFDEGTTDHFALLPEGPSNRRESSDFLVEASSKPTIFSVQTTTFNLAADSGQNNVAITPDSTPSQILTNIKDESDFLIETTQKSTIFSTQKSTFDFGNEDESSKPEGPISKLSAQSGITTKTDTANIEVDTIASQLEGIKSQIEAVITQYPLSSTSSSTSISSSSGTTSNRSSKFYTASESPVSFHSLYSPDDPLSHSNYSLCSSASTATFYTAVSDQSGSRTPSPTSLSSTPKAEDEELTSSAGED